jgi:peroxiredoxin
LGGKGSDLDACRRVSSNCPAKRRQSRFNGVMAGRKVLCPKCLVLVDEDDIGERVCPRCKARLCPQAHVVEGKICVRCGWEDPNYNLWQKRQRAAAQPAVSQQPKGHAAKAGQICPKCGVDVEAGLRRCPNCGWLFPPARGVERAAPSAMPSPSTPPVIADYSRVPLRDRVPAVPGEPSPILKGRGAKGVVRREWNFSPVRRFLQPVGAGLLVLGVIAGVVFGVYSGVVKHEGPGEGAGQKTGADEAPAQPALGAGKIYPFKPAVLPPEGGKIVVSPEGSAFEPGAPLTLSAVAAPCYAFERWEGVEGVEGSSPEVTVNFDPKKSITACFKLKDATAPAITGMKVSRYSDIGATIIWRTDEPAKGKVEYGVTKDYGASVEETAFITEHVVNLTGLSPGKTYYFSVTAEDECGNEAAAQSGSFTTVSFVPQGYSVGERAPDFTLPSYKDSYPDSPNNPSSPYYIGDQVSLSQFRGKWVLLNLWNTFCAACIGEFPHLRAFYGDEGWANRNSADARWVVVTVCLDGRTDRIVKLEEKYKYQVGLFTFPILVDDGEKRIVTELYRVTYVPKSVFIDPDGIIRAVKVGQFRSVEEVEELATQLLDLSPGGGSAE